MGDVKLATLLGAALGAAVLNALTLGFLALVPVAVVLLVPRGKAARQEPSPRAVPGLRPAVVLLA